MEGLTEKQKHILRQKLCDMKARCNNPEHRCYKDYGGRGIKVCDEWSDKKNGHSNFQKWALDNGWKEFLSIDRIDVNGNYEPSNCRWATPKEQSNNRRDNNYITIGGVTKTTQEWADQVGISMNGFKSRINSGWSEDKLLQPKKKPLKMSKAEMSKEIKYWRNLEEQGLLIKLPCKVGDEIYLLDFEEKTYDVATVMSIEIDTRDNRILLNSDYEVGTWSEDGYVFYSEIEAEKALEMEK